ncbi:MAG: cupin domain-containing protein [Desulfobacteraceae bacterium]|nr:MAG: cupin domain-containing protein [Desulfobacteraceae bacterium]
MKHINYKDIPPIQMENDQVKHVAGRLLIGKEDGASNFTMRCFEMGPGGHTPRHTHEWEHEVFVHQGHGQVLLDDTWHDMSPGSVVFVPGNVEHQFRNPTDSTLTFLCLIPSGPPEL